MSHFLLFVFIDLCYNSACSIDITIRQKGENAIMRKLTVLLLTVLLLFTLAACGGNGDDSSSAPVLSDIQSESSLPASDPTDSSDPQDDPTGTTSNNSVTTTGRSRTQRPSGDTASTTGNPDDYVSTVGEKPYTGNAAILHNKQTSRFDSQAEALRQSILNTKDTVKASGSGKTYYISPKGDDNNPGTSKDKPWRTTKHLANTLTFKAGDAVLFERGGVYRNVSFEVVSGVSYGAYGTGAKPCLYGSARNYADESLWEKTSTANIWRIALEKGTPDVGNLVFDHGKQFGLKIMRNSLTGDYQFYYDASKGYVYLYLAAGNPGKLYSDIEICVKQTMIYNRKTTTVENVTIENLCIKYTGAHGIGLIADYGKENKNITVRGCEIGWIGGSLLNASARYGNGVEFNGGIDGGLVEDCWIYQCFDAGYTNQGACYQKNITVKENLMEYNPYNIEVWSAKEIGKGGMTNCAFKDNILRFAGYGWGTLNRHGSNTSVIGNISFYNYVIPCENMVISGNIFDCSYRYLVSIAYPNDTAGRGPTITGNTWNQKPFKNSDSTASVNRIYLSGNAEILNSGTLTEMEASVKKVDKAPKAITLEN